MIFIIKFVMVKTQAILLIAEVFYKYLYKTFVHNIETD